MLNQTVTFTWADDFIKNDSFWVKSKLPWEDISIFPWIEFFVFDILFSVHYLDVKVTTYTLTELGLFDLIVLKAINGRIPSKTLLNGFYMDYFFLLTSVNITYKFLRFVNQVDYFILMINHNEELSMAFLELFYYNSTFNLKYNIAHTFNYYFQTPDNILAEYISFYSYFLISYSCIWCLIYIFASMGFRRSYPSYLTRLYRYSYSLAKENRIQFELFMQIVFFLLFFWIFNLMVYDDADVEFLEMICLYLSFYFIFIIFYLLFRYSIHYFSFLEASFTEGKNASFIAKQFVRDISNTFALFLRFSLLLFRLNIYDGLDDFLDSYYISVCDFDDDTYYDENLVLFEGNLFYTTDNETDSGIHNEIELDLIEDLFQKYFVTLGKFSYFWGFILEEAFRVSLALYITYLIIFEVHSVNISFLEDNYFSQKRS